jgi:hypothetical protein
MARMMAVLVVAAVAAVGGARAQLQDGFYAHSCPRAEQIVKGFVEEHVPHVPSVAATLLRTHFHDCFVRVSFLPFFFFFRLVSICQPRERTNERNDCKRAGLRRVGAAQRHRRRQRGREGRRAQPHAAQLRLHRPRQGARRGRVPRRRLLRRHHRARRPRLRRCHRTRVIKHIYLFSLTAYCAFHRDKKDAII